MNKKEKKKPHRHFDAVRKASITVEIALLCPLLLLCSYGAVWETMKLYHALTVYAQECTEFSKKELESPKKLRMIALVGDEIVKWKQ